MGMNLLDGKVALITGAASGIGAAAAQVFATQGARLVLADLNEEKGRELADAVQNAGGEAIFVRTDVCSHDDVAAMVAAAVTRFGRLDCAFNNAGISGTSALLHEITTENWDRMIAVNLTSVWVSMKYEIPQMLSQGGGVILNNASVGGLAGFPRQADYDAAKHGVVGLSKQGAAEYGRQGIRVNALCPGGIRTPMMETAMQTGSLTESMVSRIPLGRFGEPIEVAETAAWLCSDAASYITGHAVPVDGGLIP
ncbi:glucose 1-dehydrogenase [Nocardia sp. CDC159]|uniref:Glucose 1-dehydrogenase n=1 Tax=Nocardia pulmonis TaxID=2951408 RepID=A0A9X2E9I8_9NOCA|nr:MULTISPECIES: glucose 1-dehydrogenase [Nocardia]MCM6776612.1 glucose 1-dehydrogenase [Nocardia pulmonis]MCM6789239.1 glucose 1-dehydrogenase [Nocardia sp. CDC159]